MENFQTIAPNVRSVGQLSAADKHGILPVIGQAPEEPLLSELASVAEELHTQLGEQFHSLALRGSASRKTFVKGVSDVDLIIFAQSPEVPNLFPSHWITQTSDIDLEWIKPEDFLLSTKYRWLRFSLSFSGYCFGPQNILNKLPASSLGPHAIAHLHGAHKWAAFWRTHFDDAQTDAERKRVCSWLMKRVIRSLFEAEMLALNVYSRDIFPCANIASSAFPQYSSMIWRAAELAIAPSSEFQSISEVAETLLPFLLKLQTEQRLGCLNPASPGRTF
ncbi:hypothetical protein [Pseudovibrio sp. POLY-S9]|uniref:hypothetical protein n=1 Tax=Pseudovibrio sp. POLY-S9 TaxID=1576596 RepID=UPI000AE4F945|nr:hypothetical protein [Pseudovibrio sp. POLY-S9]